MIRTVHASQARLGQDVLRDSSHRPMYIANTQ